MKRFITDKSIKWKNSKDRKYVYFRFYNYE